MVREMNKMQNGRKVRLDQLQTLMHLACLVVYLVACMCNWIAEWSSLTNSNNQGCMLSRAQIVIYIFQMLCNTFVLFICGKLTHGAGAYAREQEI